MARLLSQIIDAGEIYINGDATFYISKEKFFQIGGILIAIMEGGPFSWKTHNHIAFKIPEEQFDSYAEQVRPLGVEVREGCCRVDGEGRSLQFYYYHNHLFDSCTGKLLEQLLKCYQEGVSSNQACYAGNTLKHATALSLRIITRKCSF